MKAYRLLVLTIIVAFSLVIGQLAFSQVSGSDYDNDGVNDLGSEAGTTMIHDLDVIKERAIDNIIRRIRRGDPNVLRFVVYDVLSEVHRRVVETIEKTKDPKTGQATTDYYQVLGNQAALHAFIGGFDNQDPKVRLRCIGFLGDWVDDIGEQLGVIGRAANERLNSAIETREEVRYGLELLQLKVLRKIDLNEVYRGNERLLKEIDPKEFVVLVHGEPFIREIFCVPPDVVLRSIRLNPWWINDDNYVSFREQSQEGEKAKSRSYMTDRGYPAYQYKLKQDSIYRNFPADVEQAKKYGYKDRAGYLDMISLYDIRYFRYQGVDKGTKYANEERYIPAIFMGLDNPSLFVRENVARILVRLTDGPLPVTPEDPTASAGALATGDDPTIITEKPWEVRNTEGQVIGVYGVIKQMANNEKYRTVAKAAWRNVMFAQFVDVHLSQDPITGTDLNPIAGADVLRDTTNKEGENAIKNPWGYTYCYRTDVADLMRRMGLGREVDTCAIPEATVADTGAKGRRYFVEDLMDLDATDAANRLPIPSWHGRDEIRDEVFEQ